MKPLLKWPGGKRFLAPDLRETISTLAPARYFEPFVGGAALFFELEHTDAVLSDINLELINFYETVRDDVDDLIKRLKRLKNSEDEYYEVRGKRPKIPVTRAARFYYLMRLSFNGIYRENLAGTFNVPYGGKTYLDPLDEHQLREGSRVLQGAELAHRSFDEVVNYARRGDLVYFDPPYTVRHNNNGFIKYNMKLFQWEDQIALARCAALLAQRGCYVIVSNADHRDVSLLYPDFQHFTVDRFSRISAQSYGRSETTESLFMSPNIRSAAALLS
jgi:DNA adenine methylase